MWEHNGRKRSRLQREEVEEVGQSAARRAPGGGPAAEAKRQGIITRPGPLALLDFTCPMQQPHAQGTSLHP